MSFYELARWFRDTENLPPRQVELWNKLLLTIEKIQEEGLQFPVSTQMLEALLFWEGKEVDFVVATKARKEIESIVYDPIIYKIWYQGAVCKLTPVLGKIFHCLLLFYGETVSKDVLLQTWNSDSTLATEVLSTNICLLNKRLKEARMGLLITSAWGVGYQLEKTNEPL